jgi:hypothetical protein
VTGAERTAERQLRAYVTVQGVGVKRTDRDGKVWLHMEVQLMNTGQTPAYNVIVGSLGKILPLPLPQGTDLTVHPNGSEISSRVLGSGQGSMARPDLGPISLEQLGKLARRETKTAFYGYGRITYRDIFDKPHYTNFCGYAFWTGSGRGGSEVIPHIADQHNDAD